MLIEKSEKNLWWRLDRILIVFDQDRPYCPCRCSRVSRASWTKITIFSLWDIFLVSLTCCLHYKPESHQHLGLVGRWRKYQQKQGKMLQRPPTDQDLQWDLSGAASLGDCLPPPISNYHYLYHHLQFQNNLDHVDQFAQPMWFFRQLTTSWSWKPIYPRVAESARSSKGASSIAKDLINSEDPEHPLFCREAAFVAI